MAQGGEKVGEEGLSGGENASSRLPLPPASVRPADVALGPSAAVMPTSLPGYPGSIFSDLFLQNIPEHTVLHLH